MTKINHNTVCVRMDLIDTGPFWVVKQDIEGKWNVIAYGSEDYCRGYRDHARQLSKTLVEVVQSGPLRESALESLKEGKSKS